MNERTESFAELRREILARGWHRKATLRVVCELLFNLAVAILGIWIFLAYRDLFVRACALLLSTAGSIGVATNTHTSSHNATSNKRWINEALTFLGYPVFLGLSACHWWRQHVVLHHPAPNVIGVDNDVDLGPWFARTHEEVQRSTGLRRLYYERLQWLLFPLAVAFIGFNMQKAGWSSLITSLRTTRTRREWIDLLAMIIHYIVWFGIPMLFFPPMHVVSFYLLRIALMGYAMFAVLAPGHFPIEAACVKAAPRTRDYFILQIVATVNFRTGFIGSLMCSGLQYQIEHHLFPNLSYVFYPKVAPLVQEFCRRNGLPYRCYAWPVVLWKSLRMFQAPPRVHSEPEAFLATLTSAPIRELH